MLEEAGNVGDNQVTQALQSMVQGLDSILNPIGILGGVLSREHIEWINEIIMKSRKRSSIFKMVYVF